MMPRAIISHLLPSDKVRPIIGWQDSLFVFLASVDSDVKQLNDIAEDLYDELQKFSGALEEGTRNVLAECLGRTVVARPSLCKKLQVRAQACK